MAITIDDFSKIWASTSPLTPYEFSEDTYKQGWNFVGATPPSRQMWDFLQKQNDEKLKYLLDNFDDYLPLSGGTITGNVFAPTPATNDNSTKIATTSFVANDLKANTVLLADTFATTIPSSADLNNYTTAGTYITGSSAITNSLTNCPVRDTSMKLVVLYVGYGLIAFGGTQIIFSLGGIFARCNLSSFDNPTWSAWKTVVSYD